MVTPLLFTILVVYFILAIVYAKRATLQIELDIYGKTIQNAIISVVYKNGVQAKLNESNAEIRNELFEKQDRYKKHFNEIFSYYDDTVFEKMLEKYPIEHYKE